MPEYFEFSLILDKKEAQKEGAKGRILEKLQLQEGKNQISQHPVALFSKKEVWFECFEETDFVEYTISLSNLVFTRENFADQMQMLIRVVHTCFDLCSSVSFAVCVYELSYYLRKEVRRMADFQSEVLSRYPILFVRKRNDSGCMPYNETDGLVCYYNETAQNLFLN